MGHTDFLLIAVVVATLSVVPIARSFFGSGRRLLKGVGVGSPEHRRLFLGDLARLLVGFMPHGELVPRMLWLLLAWSALVALVYGLLSLLAG